MEGGLSVQLRQREQSREELQLKETESAIKKVNLQEDGEHGIGNLNLQVSSEEQGSGLRPPREGEVLQGGVTVQSCDADTEIITVDSENSKAFWNHSTRKTVEQKLRPAAFEEPLLSGGGGGRYSGRLRSRTSTAKKHNSDFVKYELLEFSEDGSEDYGKGVVKQLRNAKSSWGRKKRRTDCQSSSEASQVSSLSESSHANQSRISRDHGRAKKSQDGLIEWLKTKRRSQATQRNPQSFDYYDSREAPPWAPAPPQHEISSTEEKHLGRPLHEGNAVAGARQATPSSSLPSVGRIGPSCKSNRSVRRWNMVTQIESSPGELGGRHEGAAATTRKPPIRKRKAGILAEEFPEVNGLDALSNRRARSDCPERAVQQQYYQLSTEREEMAEHSRREVADLSQQTPPPSPYLQSGNWQQVEAFLNGESGRGDPVFYTFDAFTIGELHRPGTLVLGSPFCSGRQTSPMLPLDDLGASIGSPLHGYSQLGGVGQDRDPFSIASEPSTNDSLGTAQSDARLSSDEEYHPSPGYSADHSNTDNVGIPIPNSSYPYRSRRYLSFRTDGVPPMGGSIFTSLSDVQPPPAPPDNAAQPLSNMYAVLHANPIADNQHESFGTSVAPSMKDACTGVLEGDEDFEPDDGNILDEEDEVGEEGLLDLNETPEQQKQPRKNSRARKKHRPKVFREGRPDRRRKPKNAEGDISKTKASEGKKADGTPRGRKKRASVDLISAQGKQGDHFIPVAASCGQGIDACAQCQENKCVSDAGRCMHSQGRRALGTEDVLQNRGESGFAQKEGPHTPIPEYMQLVKGPKNSLIAERVLGDTSSPNARDGSPLSISAPASPIPSRKRSGEDDRLVVADSPLSRVRRALFKKARSKRITATSKDRLENRQESLNEATAHPSAVSAAKTVEARPRIRTDASHSQELSIREALFDPAADVMGVKWNPSNSEEGVSGESRIISTEMGLQNGSTSIPEESVKRGRLRAAARAKVRHPNPSNRVKRSYTRRTPAVPRRPKQTDCIRIFDLIVNRMANLDLEQIDSGLQLVPHANQNTALIPFIPLRRKKPRARVMLDGEDKRVWRLLMTQGTSFEDDNSDKEAPRQWDAERATMKARAEKFINRMHLVQGDRRFSVWKGSVVDSIVGAFLTQNVSDHLSSSAFMCLASRFPVARKKKAAAETVQEATVTEVQVEEAFEVSPKASGIPVSSDGAQGVEEGSMTAFHVVEAFGISEKSSVTGEGSSTCCNQQAHDTLSAKLTDSERGRELTTQIPERRVGSTFQEHTRTKWHYYVEGRVTDAREQNSSCSSKASQSQCYGSVHNSTSHAGDSLEVRESEEQNTCGLIADYTSLHSGPGDVLFESSGQGHVNSINSTALVDLGEREVIDMALTAPKSWVQTSEFLEGSLIVDLSLTAEDLMIDMDLVREASRNGLHAHANRTHENGGHPIPREKNCSSLPCLEVTFTATKEIVASSGSVASSSDSFDANKLAQTYAIPGSDRNCVIGEEIGANTAGMIFPVDSFDTNESYDHQLVISSAAEPSEYTDKQLHGGVSYTTESSPLRTLKSLMRKKVQAMRKGHQKPGPKSLHGKNNSELVNSTSDDQEKEVQSRKKRPVLNLTGIDRARLEQSNITSKVAFDWEAVRLKYTGPEMGENQHESTHAGCKSFGSSDVENGVDWDAVRLAKVEDIAEVIKERGMNNVLAGRIKAFLERVQKEHGSVDLEWLRTVSVEEAKSFLLSIRGLGLKSVECIRLLTLHHLAFPVDTNVGRICVRLGWVPLEPLPEELQLHLLELYPVQETIQKYLWPRLCTLDQRTLYELHYQMITFGKVFCTKSRPNCNACPMRDDCQHFASALASARLALPAAAHEDSHSTNSEPLALPAAAEEFVQKVKLALLPSEQDDVATGEEGAGPAKINSFILSQKPCEPIVEEPRTPEPEIGDIEDLFGKDDEYDTFVGVSSQPSGSDKGSSSEIEVVLPPPKVSTPDTASKALVLLPPNSASIPVPKLKNVGRLRTVHYVYELPDSHPLVQEMDPREDDDPCFYLLAIWSPGESPNAPPVLDDMYTNGTCDGFNSSEEETVKGTVLVPCRTAMRGIFPLNGTYFQVNEVFADHASSLQPIEVPRTLLWNLRRRFVYFGTSVTTIFKGLSTEEIQACFWRGYVCVRGFDSVSRCPRPLAARLHFPASKMIRKQKGEKNSDSNAEA